MDKAQILDVLLGLAEDASLEVHVVSRQQAIDVGVLSVSGLCTVRGDVWVVLCEADPLELRIDVLSRALRRHRSGFLEGRFLPPAVRRQVGVE